MKNVPQPLKRSKELVPLSKEHHEGLLAGWKLKQGIANGTDPQAMADFIAWFWAADLKEHFRKEEDVLVPHLPADNEWVQQMWREHREIRSLVDDCVAKPGAALFVQLADALNDHIRFEERVLFPYAEKTIAPAVMASLSDALNAAVEKEPWGDAFWLRKKES